MMVKYPPRNCDGSNCNAKSPGDAVGVGWSHEIEVGAPDSRWLIYIRWASVKRDSAQTFRAKTHQAAFLESGRVRPSIECHANPLFFAPNDPALPGLIGLNDQLKFVGNAERTWNVEGGAEL